jgi:hypothetical protein
MPNPNPSPSTRFRPGQSGNPKGRPSRPPFSSRLLDLLQNGRLADLEPKETDSLIDIIAKLVVKRVIEGDPRFLKILLDRLDGRTTDWSKMDELYRLADEEFEVSGSESLPFSSRTLRGPIGVAEERSPLAAPDSNQRSTTSGVDVPSTPINDVINSENGNSFPERRKGDTTSYAIDGRKPNKQDSVPTSASLSPTGQSTQSAVSPNVRSPLDEILGDDLLEIGNALSRHCAPTVAMGFAGKSRRLSRKQVRAEKRLARAAAK